MFVQEMLFLPCFFLFRIPEVSFNLFVVSVVDIPYFFATLFIPCPPLISSIAVNIVKSV